MAIYGEGTLWSSLETGIAATIAAITGALGGTAIMLLKIRKMHSATNADIGEDRHGTDLLDRLVAERDEAVKSAKESVDVRVELASKNARLEAQLEACERRSISCEERADKSDVRASAAEERARNLSEQLLVMHMHADKLYAQIARLDPQVATRLSQEQWRQPSPKEGDQP